MPESRREIEELLAEAKYYLVQGLVEECQAALQVGITLSSHKRSEAPDLPASLIFPLCKSGCSSYLTELLGELMSSLWSLSPLVRGTPKRLFCNAYATQLPSGSSQPPRCWVILCTLNPFILIWILDPSGALLSPHELSLGA